MRAKEEEEAREIGISIHSIRPTDTSRKDSRKEPQINISSNHSSDSDKPRQSYWHDQDK